MKNAELRPEAIDDYEDVKNEAYAYLMQIKYGMALFERYGCPIKPTVFMSANIMFVISRGMDGVLTYKNEMPNKRILTIYGMEVKIVAEENVLSVGFELI